MKLHSYRPAHPNGLWGKEKLRVSRGESSDCNPVFLHLTLYLQWLRGDPRRYLLHYFLPDAVGFGMQK